MVAVKLNASDVKAALCRRHGAETASGEWTCIEEAFCGWQSAGGGVDLLALGAWQTAKAPGLPGAGKYHHRFENGDASKPAHEDARHPVVAYEVKVSRADYRREVNGYAPGAGARWNTRSVPAWPGKAWWALERSHYFMFAVPKGLLKDDEVERRARPDDGKGLWLPPEAGLIEVDEHGRCHVRVPAPRRRARPLTAPEVAELVRHAVNPNRERQLRAELVRAQGDVQRLTRQLDALHDQIDATHPRAA